MVLVDGTDGITEKTGQTGTAYLSKNGATPVASTNSITEVDAVNLPGHYYVELVASELDTLGFLSVRYKAAGTAAFQWVGQVVNDDPYINHSGPGMSGGSGGIKMSGLKKEEMIELAKMVWNVILEGKKTAKDVILATHDLAAEDIAFPKDLETPKSLTAIQNLVEELAEREAIDSSKDIASLSKGVASVNAGLMTLQKQVGPLLAPLTKLDTTLGKLQNVVKDPKAFLGIESVVSELRTECQQAIESLTAAKDTISDLNASAETTLSEFNEKLEEILNVESRFAALKTDESKEYLQKELDQLRTELQTGFKRVLLNVTEAKYKTLSILN